MSAEVFNYDAASWVLLGEIRKCKVHYATLPYEEREKFKITERKEKSMFSDIVTSLRRTA